jgi:hypothetical protein
MSDPVERDASLFSLEACKDFEPGLIRALRAEKVPPACSDVVAAAPLDGRPAMTPPIQQLLLALTLGGYLERLVVEAPRLEAPFSKEDFKEFSKQTLNTWVVEQAQAVYRIAKQGAKFDGYAKALVAVQAGLADMRFVSVLREVPLPEEMAGQDDLEEAYYSELDVALTPWKDRGRDAALVGLLEFGQLGVLHDSRVDRARALLSLLYGGRRIDRLDGLLLPPLGPLVGATVEQRLAAALPTFFVPYVLPELDPTDEKVLRSLLERGVPPATRADLGSREVTFAVRSYLARALVDLGRTYWRSSDFAAAARLVPAESPSVTDEALLVTGLAQALQAGPRDAAEMMLRGLRPTSVGNVGALDELAKQGGPLAGLAAFDAAFVLQLTPPSGDAGFWQGLARRYEAAAKRLDEPTARRRAAELARAAKDTAAALTK